jgi:hypothetical protein
MKYFSHISKIKLCGHKEVAGVEFRYTGTMSKRCGIILISGLKSTKKAGFYKNWSSAKLKTPYRSLSEEQ